VDELAYVFYVLPGISGCLKSNFLMKLLNFGELVEALINAKQLRRWNIFMQ